VSEPIKIDVWSDIACPWCYIGKRKLEAGIEAFAAEPDRPAVEVEYHSYELAPDTPVDFEGGAADFLSAHKGMPLDQVNQMLAHVTGVAAEVGLDYDFDALRQTRTIAAHQLLHYAKAHGRQLEMKERLLRAYFVEGRHVGRLPELADLAADVGLDRDDALRSLEQDEYLADVQADLRQAGEYGITGVPFFVFDGKYGVSGAQAPETFHRVLQRVVDERTAVAS